MSEVYNYADFKRYLIKFFLQWSSIHTPNISGDKAGIVFQHFSHSYTLKDEYYNSLTSDATIMVSHKCPMIGKPIAVTLFV